MKKSARQPDILLVGVNEPEEPQELAMQVRIHHEGRSYLIEAPPGSRVVRTSGEDCLVYTQDGRTEYLLTPFVVRHAEAGTKGLRLLRDEPARPRS